MVLELKTEVAAFIRFGQSWSRRTDEAAFLEEQRYEASDPLTAFVFVPEVTVD